MTIKVFHTDGARHTLQEFARSKHPLWKMAQGYATEEFFWMWTALQHPESYVFRLIQIAMNKEIHPNYRDQARSLLKKLGREPDEKTE